MRSPGTIFLFSLSWLVLFSITSLHGEKVLNPIDSCWRSDPKWSTNRQALADCTKGFGSGAIGGKRGKIYTVNDTSDDPLNPKPGTLRYGVIQDEPLWIIFEKDMRLSLKNELIFNSFKTLDGRGAKVELSYGSCITLEWTKNIIIHGISLHFCQNSPEGKVRISPTKVVFRPGTWASAIIINNSTDIWIDHCNLDHAVEGLIDLIFTSTHVTISNNRLSNHKWVMTMGNIDGFYQDSVMNVTLAFNHFGPNLGEDIPRVRYGYFHIANNYYEPWTNYAIGGSSHPTILSEGNYFIASDNASTKEVTRRQFVVPDEIWTWKSIKDTFKNGAWFNASGTGSASPDYTSTQTFAVADGSLVPSLTSDAGPLNCIPNQPCFS